MKFIQIGNSLSINVLKIDIISYRNNLIEIYVEEYVYYFSADQKIYNNIMSFIDNNDRNLHKIDTKQIVYSTYRDNSFRKIQ